MNTLKKYLRPIHFKASKVSRIQILFLLLQTSVLIGCVMMDLPQAGDISCFFAPTIQHLALSARGSCCLWDLLPHSPLRSFSFGVGVWGKRLRGQRAPTQLNKMLLGGQKQVPVSALSLILLELMGHWGLLWVWGSLRCRYAWVAWGW